LRFSLREVSSEVVADEVHHEAILALLQVDQVVVLQVPVALVQASVDEEEVVEVAEQEIKKNRFPQ